MLDNTSHKFPIHKHAPQHLWHRRLDKLLSVRHILRYADVDGAAFGGDDLSSDRLFREVDLARVGGFDLNGGRRPKDLKLEGLTIGNGNNRHAGLDDDGCLLAVG